MGQRKEGQRVAAEREAADQQVAGKFAAEAARVPAGVHPRAGSAAEDLTRVHRRAGQFAHLLPPWANPDPVSGRRPPLEQALSLLIALFPCQSNCILTSRGSA